jgi:signal transduction histidine kinase
MIAAQLKVKDWEVCKDRTVPEPKAQSSDFGARAFADEFNSVVALIRVYSGLLVSKTLSPEQRKKYLTLIREAGERAAAISGRLLDLDYGPREFGTVNLNSVVVEISQLASRRLPANIQLSVRLAPRVGEVIADLLLTEHMLLTLVINARDSMPKGGILGIETANAELEGNEAALPPGMKPGRYVVLTVSDTGIGMTPEVRARAFDPSFNPKELASRPGLGLWTVRTFAERSGGSILLDTAPGTGTMVRIYLPQAEGAHQAEALPQSSSS